MLYIGEFCFWSHRIHNADPVPRRIIRGIGQIVAFPTGIIEDGFPERNIFN